MRTISEAYKAIKESDPQTALTSYAIRRMIVQKAIPSVQSGNRYLVNLDALLEYLNAPSYPAAESKCGLIHRNNL
jgi:excisionase family DNA binding protein